MAEYDHETVKRRGARPVGRPRKNPPPDEPENQEEENNDNRPYAVKSFDPMAIIDRASMAEEPGDNLFDDPFSVVDSNQEVDAREVEVRKGGYGDGKIKNLADFMFYYGPLTDSADYYFVLRRDKPKTHPFDPDFKIGGFVARIDHPIDEAWIQENHGGGMYTVILHGPKLKGRGTGYLRTLSRIDIAGIPRIPNTDEHYREAFERELTPAQVEEKAAARRELYGSSSNGNGHSSDPAVATLIRESVRRQSEADRRNEELQEKLLEQMREQQARENERIMEMINDRKSDRSQDVLLAIVQSVLSRPADTGAPRAEVERLMQMVSDVRAEGERRLHEEQSRVTTLLEMAKLQYQSQLEAQREAAEHRMGVYREELSQLRSEKKDLESRLEAARTELTHAKMEATTAKLEAQAKAAAGSGDVNSIKAAIENAKALAGLMSPDSPATPEGWGEKILGVVSDPRVGAIASSVLERVSQLAEARKQAAGQIAGMNPATAWQQYQGGQYAPQNMQAAPAQNPQLAPAARVEDQTSPAVDVEQLDQAREAMIEQIEKFAETNDVDGLWQWVAQTASTSGLQMTADELKATAKSMSFQEIMDFLGFRVTELTFAVKSFLRQAHAAL